MYCNAMAFSDCIYIYMMKCNIVKYVFDRRLTSLLAALL